MHLEFNFTVVVRVPQVPTYLKRNQQQIAREQQQIEEYLKLREQPVSTQLPLKDLPRHDHTLPKRASSTVSALLYMGLGSQRMLVHRLLLRLHVALACVASCKRSNTLCWDRIYSSFGGWQLQPWVNPCHSALTGGCCHASSST